MKASYKAYTCFPSSHPHTGELEMGIRKEKMPYLGDIVFLLGSTLLYPATVAIVALGELFIGVAIINDQYESLKAKRKLKKLDTYSDAKIRSLTERRIAKIHKRSEAFEKKWGAVDVGAVDALNAGYEGAKIRWLGSDNTENWARMETRRTELKRTMKYINIRAEINASSLNNRELAKAALKARYESAKIRHQLGTKTKLHYLKVALIMQLPVVGLLICAHSKKTTKDALKNERLVGEYNVLKKEYPFTKNF